MAPIRPKSVAAVVFAAALVFTLSLAVPLRADPVPAPLVSADWLKANLGRDDLSIIDIRGRSAEAAYARGHIPGAVWSRYPGGWRGGEVMGSVPPPDDLAGLIGALGVSSDSTVVIVPEGRDSTEFGGAARVYWTFKYLGHDDVAILDGGWRAWSADADNPVESGIADIAAAAFTARPRTELLATTALVESRLGTGTVLIDSRAAEHYTGATKSAAVARPGHIPGAVNLDNDGFYDGRANRIKPADELEAYAQRLGLDASADIIAYCNAGHWSATNWFVLHELLGHDNVALYVDSMVGWARDPRRPVETAAGEGDDLDDM